MLPNWLYGKSKSKLAELLGGGGTPSDYNEVKAQVAQNKSDITLLSDALDTKAALTQISNPNLLDNPWFTVNQRGITSWSNEDVGFSADRWKHDGSATGNITNGVYTCDAPTYQNWEDDKIAPLLGKTVTLSWLLSDGGIGFETKTLPSALTSEYVWPFTNNYVIMALKSGNASQAARITAGVAVKAVKLELGSISTLAMDTAPDMATELVKCQRYFQRLKSTSGDAAAAATGYATATTAIRVEINYSGNMRKQPTASISSPSDFVYTQTNYASGSSPDEIAVFASFGNALSLNLTAPNGTYKQGDVYKIYASGSAYIDLDAEL